MNLNKYMAHIDAIVMRDVRILAEEVFSFVCVLIVVPLHILLLLLRIMFPWMIPFITKEEI